MVLKQALLVLADISGYTRFTRLRALSLLHAETIITELLETVIATARYPLQIAKLEGDAVFLFAEAGDDPAAAAQDVAAQVTRFFDAFQACTRRLAETSICPCQACGSIGDLKLKVIVHAGEVAFKRIRQFDEVAGEPVIRLHRLAKNTIPAQEYILVTEAFYALSGAWPGQPPETRVERVEELGLTPVRVFYPRAAAAGGARHSLVDRLRQFIRVNRLTLLRLAGLRSRAGLAPAP
jgi:class 3 adenylate cyclase